MEEADLADAMPMPDPAEIRSGVYAESQLFEPRVEIVKDRPWR
jgi:hypothetical protein